MKEECRVDGIMIGRAIVGNPFLIKEIDNLGRLCIPKEMRKMFDLKDKVEVVATTEGVLIKNTEYMLVKRK